MVELKHPRQVRLVEPLLFFVGITLLIIYAVNALNSQDWIWFMSRSVDVTPNRLVIWEDGQKTVIQPGHSDYVKLSTAVQSSLSDFNNTNLINVGFGDDSLAYYEDRGVLVELYYDNPVEFHAPFRTGKPTQLLVPVDGRHSGHNYFFRGGQGEWWFGAMRMANSEPLMQALSDLGYMNSE